MNVRPRPPMRHNPAEATPSGDERKLIEGASGGAKSCRSSRRSSFKGKRKADKSSPFRDLLFVCGDSKNVPLIGRSLTEVNVEMTDSHRCCDRKWIRERRERLD